MKLIYLGLMFCEESLSEEYRKTKSGVSMAPHIFQTNLVAGLEMQDSVDITVLNIPPTGSFLLNNKALVSKEYIWGNNYKQVGFLNLPFLKHRIQETKIFSEIKKMVSCPQDTYLLVYSLYAPFLRVAEKLKENFPEMKVCLLQTDAVPGRNDMEKYMTQKAKDRGNYLVNKAKCCDSFIVLSKHLAEPLEIGDRRYITIETICNETQQKNKVTKGEGKIFLYTGTLDTSFGITDLVDAFSEFSEGELWLCGNGDAKDYITEKSKENSNIKYYGFLNQEELAELRDKCDFLINPRRPTGTYTKYSFPSKTAEYVMTGKPVVMYKLEAMPDEYDEFIIYLKGENPEEIAGELKEITESEYDILLENAEKGRQYLLKNRTAKIAGKEIVSFLTGRDK